MAGAADLVVDTARQHEKAAVSMSGVTSAASRGDERSGGLPYPTTRRALQHTFDRPIDELLAPYVLDDLIGAAGAGPQPSAGCVNEGSTCAVERPAAGRLAGHALERRRRVMLLSWRGGWPPATSVTTRSAVWRSWLTTSRPSIPSRRRLSCSGFATLELSQTAQQLAPQGSSVADVATTTLAWAGDPAVETYARDVIARLRTAEDASKWLRRVATANLDLALALLVTNRLDEACNAALEAVLSGRVVPSNHWRSLEVVKAVEARGVPEVAELREAYEGLRRDRANS